MGEQNIFAKKINAKDKKMTEVTQTTNVLMLLVLTDLASCRFPVLVSIKKY